MNRTEKNIATFSFAVPIIAILVNTVDYLTSNSITKLIELTPSMLLGAGEFWRVLLYPFGEMTIPDAVLMVFAFTVCSAYFEKTFRTALYPLLLITVGIFYGLVFTGVFFNYNFPVTGFEPLSFFLISFWSLVRRHNSISFKSRKFKTYRLTTLVLLLWFLLYLPAFIAADYTALLKAGSAMIFGSAVGTGSYFFVRFLYNRKISSLSKTRSEIPDVPRPEELTPALISGSNIEKIIDRDKERYFSSTVNLSSDPEENEDTLNRILDKINSSGRESLSPEEIRFLDKYSQQI